MTNIYRCEAIAQATKAPGTGIRKKVASSPKLLQLVEQVTQMTKRTFKASASSVLLLDKKNSALIFKVVSSQVRKQLRGTRIGAQYGIVGWVARHGEPLIVNDVSKDWRFDKIVDTVTGFMTKSVMCAPLITHRKVIGVIEVLNRLDGANFGDDDLETLVSIASMAALAINNAKLDIYDEG